VKPSIVSRFKSALAVFKAGGLPEQWFDRAIASLGGSGKVEKPYEQSVWVQRAIKEISGPIAAVDIKFYQGETEITDAPWLNFWRKPCRNLTQADFIEALVGWLKLNGEAFIILQPEFTVPFPEVRQQWPFLMLACPEDMTAVMEGSELIGWQYRAPKGAALRLSPEQVIQLRYWNPYDKIRGMSEYEAARVATEADYLAGTFALNMARSNGDTGIVLTMKEGSSLTSEQQQQVRDQLRAKQEKARRGEYASIFVPADLEIQDPKVRAPDAQFVAQRLQNRHEIYIAFGVPPSMADIVASYSVGSASDWYRLITGACIPTAAKLEDAISQIASRMHGGEVRAEFEWDEHPVMQTVRRERIDAGIKLWDRGVSWQVVGEYLDLDLPRFKGDDVGYVSFGLAPVGSDVPDPQADPALAEPVADELVAESLRAIRTLKQRTLAAPEKAACDCCGLDFAALAIKANDPADVKKWKSLVAKRRETIRAYESKLGLVLMAARREVLKKLESGALQLAAGVAVKAAAADFLFNLSDFTRLFQAQMRATGLNALQAAGAQLFAELKRDDPWKLPQPEALQFLANRENKLAGVPGDVYDRIKTAISDGLTAGDSLRDIAAAVRNEFNEIGDKRARVIASTETAAAYGVGRDLAMRAAGIQFKQWLTSGNANVRAAHALMNGATVGIDESFTVIDPKSGQTDTVRHPADPNGQPWNVINCHCVEIAVAAPLEEPLA